jgi:hypothetical protein
MRQLILAPFAFLASASWALAECNCDKNMGSCSAFVDIASSTITYTVSTDRCAFIDYSIGAEPKHDTTTSRSETVDYLGSPPVNKHPRATCHICWDSRFDEAAGGATPPDGDDLGGISLNVHPKGTTGDLSAAKKKVLELLNK